MNDLDRIKQLAGLNEEQLDEGFFSDHIKAFAWVGAFLLAGAHHWANNQQIDQWMDTYKQIQVEDPATAQQLKKLIDDYKTIPLTKDFNIKRSFKEGDIQKIIKIFRDKELDNSPDPLVRNRVK